MVSAAIKAASIATLYPSVPAVRWVPVLGSDVTPSVLVGSPSATSSGSSVLRVAVGTAVAGTAVEVAVAVLINVGVEDGAAVAVSVGVAVCVGVSVGVGVLVSVGVAVGVSVGVAVGGSIVVTCGAETQTSGSDSVGDTNAVTHAWFVKLSPTLSGAAMTSVIVPDSVGSNGPSAAPNPVTVTRPLAPTLGVVAVQESEHDTDTNVNGADI